jgi:hypothetical protein
MNRNDFLRGLAAFSATAALSLGLAATASAQAQRLSEQARSSWWCRSSPAAAPTALARAFSPTRARKHMLAAHR